MYPLRNAFQSAQRGRLLNVQTLTVGAGTYTPTPGTGRVRLRMVAGGGGGGGTAATTATQAALAAGGSAGEYLETQITGEITGGAYSVGAAGTAGVSSTGGTGGNTSIVISGVTRTCAGGAGGAVFGALTGPDVRMGPPTSSGSPTGDVVIRGHGGLAALVVSPTGGTNYAGYSGDGGSNPLGTGGQARQIAAFGTNQIAGEAGKGFGSGGSGGSSYRGGTAGDGGAGAVGVIIVEEYSA